VADFVVEPSEGSGSTTAEQRGHGSPRAMVKPVSRKSKPRSFQDIGRGAAAGLSASEERF
jgi:hypothetical protein